MPRHARSNNKKNRARRAGERERADARRREDERARAEANPRITVWGLEDFVRDLEAAAAAKA